MELTKTSSVALGVQMSVCTFVRLYVNIVPLATAGLIIV